MQVNHLASLAKWLSVCLQTKWLWVWILLLPHIVLCLNAFAKLQNARVLMNNFPTCLYVLALSVYWMVCCQSIPGDMHGMRSCGHEWVTSLEENWHEI